MHLPTVFLVLMLLAALPALAADIGITLRPEASVSSVVYRLDQIASIESADPDTARRLGAMEIGVSPRPGYRERVSWQQVQHVIETRMPEWRGRLHMDGSQVATVRMDGVMADKQHLVQLATDFLRDKVGDSYDKVEIKPVSELRDLLLPSGAEFRPRPLSEPVSRRTAVWLNIQVAGRPYGAVPVWFSVHAWKRVPVAQRELPAGSLVRPEDFVWEVRDVMLPNGVLDRIPSEARLRAMIGRGEALTADALERVPAISRDQQVAVRIAAGNITIETAGIAMADGRIGETVKVKNTGSSEIFLAKVQERGVVTVDAR